MRVCLVDLDVENGDVPSYLDVSHRVSIADLAKISEDLTARAVADTVVVHSSGLHLLLTPREIRDTEFVTPEAVRRIIAQLRTLYHLVVVDVGSAITTTQAAAVESADITLQLVTADVPALRAARRQVVAWESLGVAGADEVHVVVNRFVRRSEIQQDTIDMLTLGQRSADPDPRPGAGAGAGRQQPHPGRGPQPGLVAQPAGDRRGARRGAAATETRSPPRPPPRRRTPRPPPRPPRRRGRKANGSSARRGGRPPRRAGRPGRGGSSVESGQATLETVAMFPFALLVLVIAPADDPARGVLRLLRRGLPARRPGRSRSATARRPPCADALPAGMRLQGRAPRRRRRCGSTVKAPLLIGPGVTGT